MRSRRLDGGWESLSLSLCASSVRWAVRYVTAVVRRKMAPFYDWTIRQSPHSCHVRTGGLRGASFAVAGQHASTETRPSRAANCQNSEKTPQEHSGVWKGRRPGQVPSILRHSLCQFSAANDGSRAFSRERDRERTLLPNGYTVDRRPVLYKRERNPVVS